MADPTETFYEDDDEIDDGTDRDEWERALQECGQGAGMGCRLAGTEYCDFECPYRDIDLCSDEK